MPLIIPSTTLPIGEYEVGKDYEVEDLFSQYGTIYRVLTNFTAPTQLNSNNVVAINLGAGNACNVDVPLTGSPNWVKLFDVFRYTSGTAQIGGLFPSKQILMKIEFLTGWTDSRWKVDLNVFATDIVEQMSFIQPKEGDPTGCWIKIQDSQTFTWDIHVVVNASTTLHEPSPPTHFIKFEDGPIPIISRTILPIETTGHRYNFAVAPVKNQSYDSSP